MKLKRLTAVFAASILALTGCSPAQTSAPESSAESSVQSTPESTSSADSENSKPLPDDVKKLLEKYPNVAEFEGFDGKLIPLDEAVKVEYPEESTPTIEYNIGYMRYAAPYFASTLGNSDWKSEGDGFEKIADWYRFHQDEADKAAKTEYFTVKPGDKLENGLTVRSAKTVCNVWSAEQIKEIEESGASFDIISDVVIEFDGTLTLEGVLFKYTAKPDYNAYTNDVFFYPDTSKNEFVPMFSNNGAESAWLDAENGLVHSGSYYLGNLDGAENLQTVDYAVEDIMGDKNYARVKITLKDITLTSWLKNSQTPQKAQIAYIELIED